MIVMEKLLVIVILSVFLITSIVCPIIDSNNSII